MFNHKFTYRFIPLFTGSIAIPVQLKNWTGSSTGSPVHLGTCIKLSCQNSLMRTIAKGWWKHKTQLALSHRGWLNHKVQEFVLSLFCYKRETKSQNTLSNFLTYSFSSFSQTWKDNTFSSFLFSFNFPPFCPSPNTSLQISHYLSHHFQTGLNFKHVIHIQRSKIFPNDNLFAW